MPEMRDDLPEPETPVIDVKQPSGMLTSMLLRLLCWAFLISNHFPFGVILSFGGSIERRPDRYAPVTESFAFITLLGGPFATTVPPSNPAPGPRSQIQSA